MITVYDMMIIWCIDQVINHSTGPQETKPCTIALEISQTFCLLPNATRNQLPSISILSRLSHPFVEVPFQPPPLNHKLQQVWGRLDSPTQVKQFRAISPVSSFLVPSSRGGPSFLTLRLFFLTLPLFLNLEKLFFLTLPRYLSFLTLPPLFSNLAPLFSNLEPLFPNLAPLFSSLADLFFLTLHLFFQTLSLFFLTLHLFYLALLTSFFWPCTSFFKPSLQFCPAVPAPGIEPRARLKCGWLGDSGRF